MSFYKVLSIHKSFNDIVRLFLNDYFRFYEDEQVFNLYYAPNFNVYKNHCSLISRYRVFFSNDRLNVLEIGPGVLPLIPVLLHLKIDVSFYTALEVKKRYKSLKSLLKVGDINNSHVELINNDMNNKLLKNNFYDVAIFIGLDFNTVHNRLNLDIFVLKHLDRYMFQQCLVRQYVDSLKVNGYGIIGFHSGFEHMLYLDMLKSFSDIRIISSFLPEDLMDRTQKDCCSSMLIQKIVKVRCMS